MRIVKVLVLDHMSAEWLPDLAQYDIVYEVVTELDLGNEEPYEATIAFLEAVAIRTAIEGFDLIIVGNNLDIGVQKARFIAEEMRDKTIVVWNTFEPGIEKPYAEMGYTTFGSRLDLEKLVSEALHLHN